MEKVSLAILLNGMLEQDPLTPFNATANCYPYQIVVPPKSEITWDVKLISLDSPLPAYIEDYTVYIMGSPGEDLFQPPTTPTKKIAIDAYEIKWTCQRTTNPQLKPGRYDYYISIGPPSSDLTDTDPAKGYIYRIDPLLVISG
jgi:hypothetical protein